MKNSMGHRNSPLTQLRRFLARMSVATLATVDEAGMPYAVSLYVVSDGEARLYFASEPRTAHCRHIARRGRVHLTAYAAEASWQQAHGIQVAGACETLPVHRHDSIAHLYCRRFPFAASVLECRTEVAFHCITPTFVRWIDNRVRFGFKTDFPWPLPRPSPSDEAISTPTP